MVKKFKGKLKWFWAWQEEKEEEWLRQMSQSGWHLKHISGIYYTFESGTPKDYIYKVDYKTTRNDDIDEYLTIFHDAGWEHVSNCCKYHYFRTEAESSVLPEIYSDHLTQLQKYKLLFRVILLILFSDIIISVSLVFNPNTYIPILVKIIYAILIVILGYASFRLYQKMKSLKKTL